MPRGGIETAAGTSSFVVFRRACAASISRFSRISVDRARRGRTVRPGELTRYESFRSMLDRRSVRDDDRGPLDEIERASSRRRRPGGA